MSLRVIGGKFRGFKLQRLDSPLTRPTKAILKESLFNTLQTDILDFVFIEGFGGSGSVGIEALSRGAKESIFIESNPQSFATLKNNLSRLPAKNYRAFLGDSFLLLPSLIEGMDSKSILYLDPPFCIRENMQDIYQKCFLLVQKILNPSLSLVIFEHLSTYEMPQNIGNFCIIKHKKFGKSSLSYFLRNNDE